MLNCGFFFRSAVPSLNKKEKISFNYWSKNSHPTSSAICLESVTVAKWNRPLHSLDSTVPFVNLWFRPLTASLRATRPSLRSNNSWIRCVHSFHQTSVTNVLTLLTTISSWQFNGSLALRIPTFSVLRSDCAQTRSSILQRFVPSLRPRSK
jgi:hypothetical protein